MITGTVDEFGRSLIPLLLQTKPTEAPIEIVVWIDTGFTGDLVLPISTIRQLGLKLVSNVEARLADGSISSYDVFVGWTNWFGIIRKIEVIAGDSSMPLFGIELLSGLRLTVDFASNEVKIEQPG
jgi:clan AA aspartic protease